jgi:gluconolactonase
MHDQSGRVFRIRPGEGPELLVERIPGPNGVAIDRAGRMLFVSVTRANSVWRIPIRLDGSVGKVGVHLTLSGGLGGPDGLALDPNGGLSVAHFGLGDVWVFDSLGRLTGRVGSTLGTWTTNVAYYDGSMYVTEASTGSVLHADLSGSFKG